MARAIDTVFVEILPDLSKFERQATRDVKAALAGAEAAASSAASDIEDDFDKAFAGASADIRRVSLELRRLERDIDVEVHVKTDNANPAAGLLGDLEKEGIRAGTELSEGVGKGLTKNVEAIGAEFSEVLVPALAVAGAALAPVLGAAVAGAVIGTVGGLGLVGGIVAAARDPRIKAAATDLKDTLLSGFGTIAEPFIRPLLDAFRLFEAQSGPIFDKIAQAIAPLSAAIEPLANGFVEFINQLLPGLSDAFNASLPALLAFAQELPILGKTLGEMFAVIAGSKGTLTGFVFLLKLVEGTFIGVGFALRGLSDIFQIWFDVMTKVTGAVDQLVQRLPFLAAFAPITSLIAGTFSDMSQQTDELRKQAAALGLSLDGTALSMNQFGDAFDRLNGKARTLIESQLGVEQAIDDLAQSVKEGTASIDLNSEAGRRNVQILLQGTKAAADAAAQKQAEGASVEEVNKTYQDYINRLRDTLVQAGASKTQIDQLITSIGAVPPTVSTTVSVPGAGSATQGLQEVKRAADEVPPTKTTNVQANTGGFLNDIKRVITEIGKIARRVTVTLDFITNPIGSLLSGIFGRASGGPVTAGNPFIVGERGPELFVPRVSGSIVPNKAITPTDRSSGGIQFMPGAIAISFSGVVPTQAEATRTGEAVAMGISGALARRDTRVQIRAV